MFHKELACKGQKKQGDASPRRLPQTLALKKLPQQPEAEQQNQHRRDVIEKPRRPWIDLPEHLPGQRKQARRKQKEARFCAQTRRFRRKEHQKQRHRRPQQYAQYGPAAGQIGQDIPQDPRIRRLPAEGHLPQQIARGADRAPQPLAVPVIARQRKQQEQQRKRGECRREQQRPAEFFPVLHLFPPSHLMPEKRSGNPPAFR